MPRLLVVCWVESVGSFCCVLHTNTQCSPGFVIVLGMFCCLPHQLVHEASLLAACLGCAAVSVTPRASAHECSYASRLGCRCPTWQGQYRHAPHAGVHIQLLAIHVGQQPQPCTMLRTGQHAACVHMDQAVPAARLDSSSRSSKVGRHSNQQHNLFLPCRPCAR